MAEFLEESSALESTTVAINRTATTVKGGRRMSFSALVVVGDRSGSVGVGYGKGRGVPTGIEKAQKDARKNLFPVKLNGGTLPHEVTGRFGASKVRLIPAAPGTGVIAGGTVRAVLEMAGVHDCLTKAYGSTNKINLCKAVVDGLQKLRTREEVASLRNVEIEKSTVDEILETSRKSMEAMEAAQAAKADKVVPAAPAAPVAAKQEEAPAAPVEEKPAEPAAEAKAEEPQQDAPAEGAEKSE